MAGDVSKLSVLPKKWPVAVSFATADQPSFRQTQRFLASQEPTGLGGLASAAGFRMWALYWWQAGAGVSCCIIEQVVAWSKEQAGVLVHHVFFPMESMSVQFAHIARVLFALKPFFIGIFRPKDKVNTIWDLSNGFAQRCDQTLAIPYHLVPRTCLHIDYSH